VDVTTTDKLPGPGETWLSVETLVEETKPEVVTQAGSLARLVVLTGKAEPLEMKLEKAWINIGRTREAVQAGGPTRRNDVAFVEEDAVGKTVSRQHAHIERDAKGGQYRLFNDRVYKGADNCGVYVVRGGVSQPVHRGGHGSLLRDGDEIHLAQAVLRFELGAS
jgi:pSer/pThr/pTyr-binding forkhead associated (FHA) protein